MARIVNSRSTKMRSASPNPRKSETKLSAASRRGKPEGHIPRPPNAFIIFRQELNKRSVSAGEAHQKSISSVACALWRQYREMEPEKLEKYYKMAEQLKAEHKALYPDYVYRPRKRVVEKKRRQCRTSALEEDIRKQAVLAAHAASTGDAIAQLPTPVPTRSTRSTRSKKPAVKIEADDVEYTPPYGLPSPLPDAEVVASPWLSAPASPDAYDVPTLASSPASTPTSPVSPIVSTPLDSNIPTYPFAHVAATAPYESLLQLPPDFAPGLNAPIDFSGYEIDYNGHMQWTGFETDAGTFQPKPEVHDYNPYAQHYGYDVNVSGGLKPFCDDQFLPGYTTANDMTQLLMDALPAF